MGGSYAGWILFKLAIFIVGSFIFSYIFWMTYHKVSECQKKKGKKKK